MAGEPKGKGPIPQWLKDIAKHNAPEISNRINENPYTEMEWDEFLEVVEEQIHQTLQQRKRSFLEQLTPFILSSKSKLVPEIRQQIKSQALSEYQIDIDSIDVEDLPEELIEVTTDVLREHLSQLLDSPAAGEPEILARIYINPQRVAPKGLGFFITLDSAVDQQIVTSIINEYVIARNTLLRISKLVDKAEPDSLREAASIIFQIATEIARSPDELRKQLETVLGQQLTDNQELGMIVLEDETMNESIVWENIAKRLEAEADKRENNTRSDP